VVLDYLSLFVIRRWLAKGGKRPVFAILTGAVIGATIVLLVLNVLFIIVGLFITESIWQWVHRLPGLDYWVEWFMVNGITTIPAFAVHLWLPLLGAAILLLRIINVLLWSVTKMQWFLKQGHLHPLDAIGYVASVLVFLATLASRALKGTI
jgi:hypothetical protein